MTKAVTDMKQKTTFLREQAEAVSVARKRVTSFPNALVLKCPACRELLYYRDYERNRKVCSLCNYHFRLSTSERVHLLVDPGSFVPIDARGTTGDGRPGATQEEAVLAGYAAIESSPCVLAMTNPHFKGTRAGWLIAELVSCAIERALERRLPVCTIVAGLTLKEDLCSRMQLAKVTSVLARLGDARLPYISVLADHVAGTAASFTLLGDVNLAEYGSCINFLYPSVLRKEDGSTSCEHGISAETLQQRGMLDALVPRYKLRSTLARFLRFYAGRLSCPASARERERPIDAGAEDREARSGYRRPSRS